MVVADQAELVDAGAERAVLAGLMLDPSVHERVSLVAEDFYTVAYQEIFMAVVGLIDDRKPTDPIAVASVLTTRGKLDVVGGHGALWELSLEIPSVQAVPHYADLVRELSALRSLRRVASGVLGQVAHRIPSATISSGVLKGVEAVVSRTSLPAWVSLGACIHEAVEQIDRAYHGEVGPGVSSGLKTLDGKVGGFQPGHMIVMAGRPSMGKTALALGTALSAAQAGNVVGMFSLEMSRTEIAKRLISMHADTLTVSALDYGRVTPDGWAALTDSASSLAGLPFYVADRAYITMDVMHQMAFRLQRECGLGVLIVDYLQLIAPEGRTDNRVASWTAISRKLKVLAKELAVPIVVLSQLSRECERRQDKRPVLSDLRESGAIEQDADMVICIYRDEVYDEDSDEKGVAELLIRKNRHGPIGEARVSFDGKTTKFSDGLGV